MKNIIYIFVLSIILFSCNENEIIYSCDPEIDAIVKSGSVEFSEITLSEFLEYDIVLQKAIFRSFSNEKKRSFWLEKLDSVLVKNEFNTKEELHIKSLKEELIPGYFNISELDSKDFKNRLQFSRNWYKYASDSLNWNDSQINYIRYSLYLNENQYIISRNELIENSINTLQLDCNCTSEADDCDAGHGFVCSEGNCTETSYGCGLFWLSPCTGGCE